MIRQVGMTASAALAALLLAATAAAASASGQPPLAPPKTTNEVIVRFHHGAPAAARAAARQSVGASAVRRLLLGDTQVVRVKPGTAHAASRALERMKSVVWAEPNLPVEAGAAAPNDPDFGELWGLRNTGQTVRAAREWLAWT